MWLQQQVCFEPSKMSRQSDVAYILRFRVVSEFLMNCEAQMLLVTNIIIKKYDLCQENVIVVVNGRPTVIILNDDADIAEQRTPLYRLKMIPHKRQKFYRCFTIKICFITKRFCQLQLPFLFIYVEFQNITSHRQ